MIKLPNPSYFPQGARFHPPPGNEDVKISINYFDEKDVYEVQEPWANYCFGKKYKGLKLLYNDKIISLLFPPLFLEVYTHVPGSQATGFISLQDHSLLTGALKEGDEFEMWFLHAFTKKYWCIGKGKFEQICKQELRSWDLKDFVKMYSKKLVPMLDKEALLIELSDGLSRLDFIRDFKARASKNNEEVVTVKLFSDTIYFTAAQVKEILNIINFIKLECSRYSIDYEQQPDKKSNMQFKNIQVLIALWNSIEFVTLKISL